ncbi:MAG TPA: DUF433 domain-containing protein [Pirellulaceae bacterium]|jgi:uncharacterized protein (DUF433 family)
MEAIVSTSPNVMHGMPCFTGTRVAAQALFDHLEAGYTVDGFLTEFPTVTREQVIGLLEQLKQQLATSAAKVA